MVMNCKDELVKYLKRNLAKGYTFDSLNIALLQQGYTKIRIQQAIRKANEELAKKAPILKEKPKIKYEILDELNKPIKIKKSFWRKFFLGFWQLFRNFLH
jgi:hypothetical protein